MSKTKTDMSTTKKILIAVAVVLFVATLATSTLVAVYFNVKLKPSDFSPVAPVSGEGTGYYRHCYEELTDEEKAIYSVILSEIYNMPERIEIPALGTGNLDAIFGALSRDNPDLFCLGLNCTVYKEGLKTYFEPVYTMTLQEYNTKLSQAKNRAAEIVEATKQYTSVYEKELYVHDYIINNCVYTEPTEKSNTNDIYGCLVEGKASCEGYSRSFQLIMNMLDIDNRLVTGESSEDGVNYIGHMWNYVILEGEGYFVDVTFDDPRSSEEVLRHTYFNVDTEDILVGHKIDKPVTLPLSTADKFNYHKYENAYFTTGAGEAFETQVDSVISSAMYRGYKCIELRFSDPVLLEQAKNTLFKDGVIYNIYTDVGLTEGGGSAQVYYSQNENMNTLCLFF